MKKAFAGIIFALIISIAAITPVAANPDRGANNVNTIRKIRKELVTLPFYGVFDNLAFEYEEGGDATRAFIAANGAPGVFSVKNNLRIEKNR
jgi:hypothetical protein